MKHSGDAIRLALTVLQEAFVEAKNRDSRLMFLIVRDEPGTCSLCYDGSDKSADVHGIHEIAGELACQREYPLTMKPKQSSQP